MFRSIQPLQFLLTLLAGLDQSPTAGMLNFYHREAA